MSAEHLIAAARRWQPEVKNTAVELAILGMFAFTLLYWAYQWESIGPYHHAEGVKVIRRIDDYRYVLRFPDAHGGPPHTMAVWFCKDTVPPYMVPGCVLSSLRWEERTECWEVGGKYGLGYDYVSDYETGDDFDEHGVKCFDGKSGTIEHPLGEEGGKP